MGQPKLQPPPTQTLPVPPETSLGALARRLAVAGLLLAGLTVLASIALAS